ncbi:MAG: AAA family ATPase [Candidatus Eisenbacteria bacterium]
MTARPFGLRDDPFVESHDRRFLYPHRTHREAVDRLSRAVAQRAPFAVLTGVSGAGKTSTLNAALAAVPEATVVLVVAAPSLGIDELRARLLAALGETGDTPADSAAALAARLAAREADAPPVALVIDEAQDLADAMLEELRLLSNLEPNGRPALSVVLAGRTRLETRLEQPEYEPLRQRIVARCRIEPLSARETEAFIHQRVSVCGGPGALFPRPTCRAVHALTHGVAREVQLIAGEAMAQAHAWKARAVETSHVTAAAEALGFRSVLADAPVGATREAAEAPVERALTEATPDAAPALPVPATTESTVPDEPAPTRTAANTESTQPAPVEAAASTPPTAAPPTPAPTPSPKPVASAPPPRRAAPAPTARPVRAPAARPAPPKPAPAARPAPTPAVRPTPAAATSAEMDPVLATNTRTSPDPVVRTPAVESWLARFNDPNGPPRIGSRVAVDDSTIELARVTGGIPAGMAEASEAEGVPPAPKTRPRRGRVVGRGRLKPSRWARRPALGGWIAAALLVVALGGLTFFHRDAVVSRLAAFGRAATRPHASATTASAPAAKATPGEPSSAAVGARTAETTPVVEVQPLPLPRPSKPAPQPARAKPATAPTAALPEAPAATASTSGTANANGTTGATAGRHYRVLVGTYLVPDRASSERDRIAAYTSFPCRVLRGHEDGAEVFRVLVGPFSTRQEAESASEHLSESGAVPEARVVGWFGPKAPRD